MNPRARDNYTVAYNKWVVDQTPENMADLVSAFMPTVNSELQQYSGSRELLRARAKSYVVQAIKSFNPMSGAKLNSWVVTNLRQLSRYGKKLRPVKVSEDMARSAAELNRVSRDMEDRLGRKPTVEELQDETGWSPKSIEKIRASSYASVNAGSLDRSADNPEAGDVVAERFDNLPFLQDSVYMSLSDRDKDIYDYKLGLHGKPAISGTEIASMLGVTPALVSQRSSYIGDIISQLGAK